ncbi:MAG: hypothetical protein ACJ79H_14110 [Myxococcales bacterium]
MDRSILVVLVAAVGCGSGNGRTYRAGLELVAPDTPIEMQGGQTREIQLMVVGTQSEQATFSADLPPFAKLTGSLLTLSPKRADEGQYELTVTALAGDESARAKMQVVVRSPNTAPSWDPFGAGGILLGDDAGIYGPGPMMGGCPGASCELHGVPAIYASVCDSEDDVVTVDVEIVPLGRPFTKTASHSRTGQAGVSNSGPRCATGDAHCSCFEIPATGLAPGAAYAFAVRVSDARGAVATRPDAPDGWVGQPFFQFKTAP